MVQGIGFKEVGKLIKMGKLAPQQLIAKETVGVGKAVSNDLFGYDFMSLGIKLLVFYGVALIFGKFMETVIWSRGIFATIAPLFGFKIPKSEELPTSLIKLFTEGYKGFKYWDVVKIVGVILVIAEFLRYTGQNKKSGSSSSPMTIGIFILIISALTVTTVPELFKRLKGTDFNLESFR